MWMVQKMQKNKYADRTFVVCHMISSIDGKIDGNFFERKEIEPIRKYADQIRSQLDCTAVIFGAKTVIESFDQEKAVDMQEQKGNIDRTDYIAQTDVNQFFVAIDPMGEILWKNKYIEKRGCPKSHIIEVLVEEVSDDYIGYLRECDISYVFAGKSALDCNLLLEKLKQKFEIDRAMLSGGGITNWSFLQAGKIDELSIVICPVADGTRNSATLFDKSVYADCELPRLFSVDNIQTTPGNGLWLVYHPER